MERVKLKIPNEKPLFSTKIPVRINDVNYGGHVGNDAFLTILHEARMQFFGKYGFSEVNAGGNSLIMADVMMAYKGKAFYGDTLLIDIYVIDITVKSFDMLYFITAVRDGIVKDIVHAKTGLICFNYESRRIEAMTETLKKVLINEQE